MLSEKFQHFQSANFYSWFNNKRKLSSEEIHTQNLKNENETQRDPNCLQVLVLSDVAWNIQSIKSPDRNRQRQKVIRSFSKVKDNFQIRHRKLRRLSLSLCFFVVCYRWKNLNEHWTHLSHTEVCSLSRVHHFHLERCLDRGYWVWFISTGNPTRLLIPLVCFSFWIAW